MNDGINYRPGTHQVQRAHCIAGRWFLKCIPIEIDSGLPPRRQMNSALPLPSGLIGDWHDSSCCNHDCTRFGASGISKVANPPGCVMHGWVCGTNIAKAAITDFSSNTWNTSDVALPTSTCRWWPVFFQQTCCGLSLYRERGSCRHGHARSVTSAQCGMQPSSKLDLQLQHTCRSTKHKLANSSDAATTSGVNLGICDL